MPEESDVNDILAMWGGGISIADIANELDISEGTVRGVLKAHAQEFPEAKRSSINVDAVIADYLGDESVGTILDRHGITHNRLYGILADAEVPIRKLAAAASKERQMNEAVDMYQNGLPLHQIYSDTGVHQPQLHAELHKRGVELRRPRR